MSVEKITKLIDEAPQTAAWWAKNKHTIVKKNKIIEMIEFGCTITAWLGPIITLGLFAFLNSKNGYMYWTSMALVGLVPMCIPFLLSMKGLSLHSKQAQNSAQKLGIDIGSENGKKVSSWQKKEVLDILLNHSDPSIHYVLPKILSVRALDLPKSWWSALQESLNDVPSNRVVVQKTADDEVNDIYTKIDHATNQVNTNVLRL